MKIILCSCYKAVSETREKCVQGQINQNILNQNYLAQG